MAFALILIVGNPKAAGRVDKKQSAFIFITLMLAEGHNSLFPIHYSALRQVFIS